MENNNKNDNKRNVFSQETLLEAEELINHVKYDNQPASSDFRQSLKTKILEKRHQKKHMTNPFKSMAKLFTIKRMAPVLASFVIVALVITTAHYWPTTSPFKDFSKLIINPAYAQDNFEISATQYDSLGVESNSSFIITSKQDIDADLLKDNIILEPAVDFKFKKINDKTFEVIPSRDLDAKIVYSVMINASFVTEAGVSMARNYSWAFQVKDTFKVVHTLPREKGTNVPVTSGIEITFSHDNFDNYEDKITIVPAVKGRYEQHKRTLVFVPESLSEEQIYTVTVDKSLGVNDSRETLNEDYVFQFETRPANYHSSRSTFNFTKQNATFASTQVPAFQFYNNGTSLEEYEMQVYSFTSEASYIDSLKTRDLTPYWSYNRSVKTVDVSSLTEVTTVLVKPQEQSYTKYLVMPEPLSPGYYVVQTTVGDNTRQVVFQVSDLAVYLTVTDTEAMAWVHDIKTGDVAKGANVEILGTDFKGKLDKEGLATFDTELINIDYDSTENPTYYLKVSYKNNTTIVPLDEYRKSLSNQAGSYWDYVYTDRAMYKPQDTVNIWGFVKPREGRSTSDKVTAKISNGSYYNYYYENIDIATVEMDVTDGAFSGQMNLDNLTPGYYSVTFYDGDNIFSNTYFRVQDYVKPAYQLQVLPAKDVVFAGEAIDLTYKASFFEGTPVSGLNLSYQLGKANNTGTTNDEGVLTDSYIYPYTCVAGSYSCSFPTNKNFSVKPIGPEEGDIYDEVSVRIFGAKVDSTVTAKVNKDDSSKATINVTAYNVDLSNLDVGGYNDYRGDVKAGATVKIKVDEVSYTKIETGDYYDFINKVTRKTYRYKRNQDLLTTFEGVTDSNGNFSGEINVNSEKSYTVSVEVYDEDGRFDSARTYVSQNYVYYNNYNGNDSYELKAKKTADSGTANYAVGEEVEVELVKNGQAIESSQNDFLYYKMQQGLLDYTVMDEAQYKFDFDKKYIPNIYMKGVYFDGQIYHENGSDWYFSHGGLLIKYDYELEELNFDISTDKSEYAPGEKAKISVSVTARDGKAVKANLNLNLVDEAFYKLTYDNANSLNNLYENVDSGLRKTYTSHEEAKFATGAEGGGCFVTGTMVRMSDGTEKAIEDVREGDFVLTFSDSYSNKLVPAKVLGTDYHVVDGYYLVNGHLKVTPEHIVYVNDEWKQIGEASIGDFLKDETGNYISIYSMEKIVEVVEVYNLHVDEYHTYIADGIYVHNDKGGGGRSVFKDTALFFSAQTDSSGNAVVELTVPDNITSWRITAQAITKDLKAGVGRGKLDVSLPVFVLPTMADEYLVGDKPSIAARAYGRDLQSRESVTYTFESEDLDIKEREKAGQAYVPTFFDINQLKVGKHEIEVGVRHEGDFDSVIRPITVIDSRLSEKKQDFYSLEQNLKIDGNETGDVNLIFSDENQGKYYWLLSRLSWGYGDRVDQLLGRVVGNNLLAEYFGEDASDEDFTLDLYQLPTGGVSLLPYSDEELELSAKVAVVASDEFDKANLTKYFYSKLLSRESNKEEIAQALYGLAGLDEPVLLQINNFAEIEDLKYNEKLYIALAANEIGDSELARLIYVDLLKEYGEETNLYIRLNVGEDGDDILSATAMASILAAGLNDEKHEALFTYVEDNYGTDILTNLEKLQYVKNVMPHLIPGPVKFEIEIDGKTIKKELEHGNKYNMRVSSDKLASFKLVNVEGKVGMMTEYISPVSNIYQATKDDVTIGRKYQKYRTDTGTTTFEKDDIVEVWIYPTFSEKAPDGSYQVTDYLPSGLTPVNRMQYRGQRYSCSVRYPYDVDGQVIKFSVYNGNTYGCRSDAFKYYARVVTPGQYVAEPVMIQMFRDLAIKNYGQFETITINK